MLIHPWDAALDDEEWRAWLADGHDFGQLVVNGLSGCPPTVIPTDFTVEDAPTGTELLVYLARPNPVWVDIEVNAHVVVSVDDDYAHIPTTWRARAGGPDEGRRPDQLLHRRPGPCASPRTSTTRPGRSTCPPARLLPARWRPPRRDGRRPALRPDAARHPRPAPAGDRARRKCDSNPPRTAPMPWNASRTGGPAATPAPPPSNDGV